MYGNKFFILYCANKPCFYEGTPPLESGYPLSSSSCSLVRHHEVGVGGQVVLECLVAVAQVEQEQMLKGKKIIFKCGK